MSDNLLDTYLTKSGFSFSDKNILLLNNLLESTLETNKCFNLTSITDKDDFIEKMIIDSLLINKFFNFENLTILDVGTGAGFPGLPLAITNPNAKFDLLDSTKKKIDYLNNFINRNRLDNVKGLCSRIEDYAHSENRECYDVILARAVSSLNILIELVVPLLKVDGIFIAFKSVRYEEEIKEAQVALEKLNAKIIDIKEDYLPLSKEKRVFIFVKKIKKTPLKYPRSYSLIKKTPLK